MANSVGVRYATLARLARLFGDHPIIVLLAFTVEMSAPVTKLRRLTRRSVAIFLVLFCSPWLAARAQATDLPAKVVVARKKLCPLVADEAARHLWMTMAAKYTRIRDSSVSRFVRVGSRQYDDVSSAELGVFARAEARAQWVSARWPSRDQAIETTAATIWRTEREALRTNGYATRIPDDAPPPSYPPGAYLSWVYPRFDNLQVEHFIEADFAAAHTFAMDSTDQGLTIVFCGVDRSRPWIEGTMDFTPDTVLMHAAYRYVTPRPVENAGGEVWFETTSGADTRGRRYLWPQRSVYFRRLQSPDRWYQDAWINIATCLEGPTPLRSRSREC